MQIPAELQSTLADRYTIIRELGSGGMATVYLARDLRHERNVAIKVLHPELAAVLGAERFLSEIRMTASLQHPHILPLFDSGSAEGQLFYVMPYVEGETLRTRLERETQLPIADAVRIATEVADALQCAHDLGVVHRDIKPENILLRGGHALVADFGIALAVQTAGGQRMTQTGLSLGTPQYMAPEQAMGEKAVDARADIYALGAVTYEMLTGEAPFTGPSAQAIVARVLTTDPVAPSVARRAVPPAVDQAVLTALAKLPADRQSSASEFARALVMEMPTAMLAKRTYNVQRRSRVPGVLAFAGVAVAGVFGGWAFGRDDTRGSSVTAELIATSILPPAAGSFGEKRSIALSPDGRQLAFVFASADGNRSLWIRRLSRLESEPVPNTTNATAPFWSPDGRSLGFFADGYLVVQDENGEKRRVCPAARATSGSWSADGRIVFAHQDGISIVAIGKSDCTLIVREPNGAIGTVAFLPDERIAYSHGFRADIDIADASGKHVGSLPLQTREFAIDPTGYVLFQSATDVLAADAQAIDFSSLTLRGTPRRVASGVRSQSGIHTMSASNNGAFAFLPGTSDRPYLVYDAAGVLLDTVRVEGTWSLAMRQDAAPIVAVGGSHTGIWMYDIPSNRATRLIEGDNASAGSGTGNYFPAWSPDGSHIAFARVTRQKCSVAIRDRSTGADRAILEMARAENAIRCWNPLDWSRGGTLLLARRDTELDIIPIDAPTQARTIARGGRLNDGRFSPDGRFVAFSSDETGRAEIYVQAIPVGTAQRVSTEGGRWAQWNRAGTTLTWMSPSGKVQRIAIGKTGEAVGAAQTLFLAWTWRRATFDDNGTGFGMVGDGSRYIVRQSPSALGLAYYQNWRALLQAGDTARAQHD